MSVTRENEQAAVVIGASVGAIEALSRILPAFSPDYALAVIVVVHIPPDRKSLLAELFTNRCNLMVKEAEDKELIKPGTVYFAPSNYHLLVEPDFRLSLSNEEPIRYSRPAIDATFLSAADAYGDALTGVVLTGASNDGANGLRAVCDAGGIGLIQLPETAEGSAMPRAAMASCPDATAMSLEDIASILKNLTLSR